MTYATTPESITPQALASQGSSSAPTASAVDCERRLRFVLRMNAATSTITGLTMAVAPGAVDELLGTGHAGWVRLVGLALLFFAAFVAWLATTERRLLQRYTPGIIAGDVSWVIASVVTVVLGWYSGTGNGVVLTMALGVDVFALLQLVAVRRLPRA